MDKHEIKMKFVFYVTARANKGKKKPIHRLEKGRQDQ